MHRAEYMPGECAVSFLIQGSLLAPPVPDVIDAPPAKRNTKLTGDISELQVAAALAEAGYIVSKPFGENARYDLVADNGERLPRIQVKTGRLRNGIVRYNCYSSHAHRHGRMRPYFGEIDFLAVYCPQTRKVYLLPESALVATVGHLRIGPTKNNMAKRIRWASEYELA
jgi:hypothetical protein